MSNNRPAATQVSNEDLQEKLDAFEIKFNKQEAKLDLMLIRTDELILAYNTAKGVTVFVKWLAGLVTAGGILWTAVLGGKIPHP
jgi:hypothetical protein